MKNKFKTIRLFIFALIFVLIAVILYFSIFIKIVKENKLIIVLRSDLELEVMEEQLFLSVKNLVRNIEDERKELDSYFVPDDEIAEFLKTIEELGAQTGAVVKINTVDVEEVNEGNSVSELLRVSIDASGSRSSVFRVLSLLETVPLSLLVEDVRISVSGGEEDQMWRGSYDIIVDKLK